MKFLILAVAVGLVCAQYNPVPNQPAYTGTNQPTYNQANNVYQTQNYNYNYNQPVQNNNQQVYNNQNVNNQQNAYNYQQPQQNYNQPNPVNRVPTYNVQAQTTNVVPIWNQQMYNQPQTNLGQQTVGQCCCSQGYQSGNTTQPGQSTSNGGGGYYALQLNQGSNPTAQWNNGYYSGGWKYNYAGDGTGPACWCGSYWGYAILRTTTAEGVKKSGKCGEQSSGGYKVKVQQQTNVIPVAVPTYIAPVVEEVEKLVEVDRAYNPYPPIEKVEEQNFPVFYQQEQQFPSFYQQQTYTRPSAYTQPVQQTYTQPVQQVYTQPVQQVNYVQTASIAPVYNYNSLANIAPVYNSNTAVYNYNAPAYNYNTPVYNYNAPVYNTYNTINYNYNNYNLNNIYSTAPATTTYGWNGWNLNNRVTTAPATTSTRTVSSTQGQFCNMNEDCMTGQYCNRFNSCSIM